MRVGSANFANLTTKLVAMATTLERSHNGIILNEAPPWTANPENFATIGTVDSEITTREVGPLEIKKNKQPS